MIKSKFSFLKCWDIFDMHCKSNLHDCGLRSTFH